MASSSSSSSSSPTLSTPTQYIDAANGVRFAYRNLGPSLSSGIPLVLHIHFRGNMDYWDPALLDPLAAVRPVLIFDQAGVGRSSGEVATTIQGWADNVLSLLDALNLTKIDLLGFSMGGMTVQQVALTRPNLIRRLILAGTRASAPGPNEKGQGIVWPEDARPAGVFKALSEGDANDLEQVKRGIAITFFPHTDAGRAACEAYWSRIAQRNVPGEPNMWQYLSREGTARQIRALGDWNSYKSTNSWDRLGELKMPVLVVNGDNDMLIPTGRSWTLHKRIEGAGLIVYPRSGHGFLWQWAPQFARDVNGFLTGDWPETPAEVGLGAGAKL